MVLEVWSANWRKLLSLFLDSGESSSETVCPDLGPQVQKGCELTGEGPAEG